MKRTWVKVTIGVVLVGMLILIALGAVLVPILLQVPYSQGERLEIRSDVVGIDTGGSYAWIVRTPTGAALVDTGMDPEASALKAELANMGLTADDVHTVLLTHGHYDHSGGASQFPRATVVHGPGEGPLLRGEAVKLGWMAGLFSSIRGAVTLPSEVVEAADGQILDVDGITFQVISTPGHTMGSASYLGGGVLFSGDTLVSHGTTVKMLPGAFTSDAALLKRSVHRLSPLDAEWMADGHGGKTPDAAAAIDLFLQAQPKP
ncbi:MAG: MBL fold metallo-hydrolase [Myxococcota bacterium]